MNNISAINSVSLQFPQPFFDEQINTITRICQEIFKFLKKIITFPLRFIGSKTISLPKIISRLPELAYKHIFHGNQCKRSFQEELFENRGYEHFHHTPILPNDVKEYLTFASCNAAVNSGKAEWMEPYGFTPLKGMEKYLDPSSGLKVVFFEKGDEVIAGFVAVGGHHADYEDHEPEKEKMKNLQILSSLGSMFGGRPQLYRKAEKLIARLQENELKGKKITLTGQCLGGSIAQYVALKYKMQAVCLNSLPLGPGLQTKISQETLSDADRYITHIVASGDVTSDQPLVFKIIDLALSFLGFRTAGNFGKTYVVPSIYNNMADTHMLIVGSMFAHWKPEHLQLSKDLTKDKKKFAEILSNEVKLT